jgi:two-component system, cell cycle sensor histidine kinase and response regulator CckA
MAHTHTEAPPAQAQARPSRLGGAAAGLALAAAAGLFAYGIGTSEPLWVVAVLGALSFVGLLTLFAARSASCMSAGCPASGRSSSAIIDAVADACVVTDRRGRVIYANAPYRALVHGHGRRLVGIENLYAGYPDIAERVYRLAQAARDGQQAAEEFRLNPGSGAAGARPTGRCGCWCRSPGSRPGLGQRYTLWRHSDVTADRERQEAAFAKLQFIISYLDRAPAGFFSTTARGESPTSTPLWPTGSGSILPAPPTAA